MQLLKVRCRNCKKVLFECSKEEVPEADKVKIGDKMIVVKICPKCKEENTYKF